MSPRARRLALGIGVPALIILLPALVLHDVRRRANAELDRHRLETQTLVARLRATGTERPPLHPPGIEANAWDDYRPAIRTIASMPYTDKKLCPILYGETAAMDPAAFEPIWTRYAPQVEQIRRGLNCRVVDPHFPIEEGLSAPVRDAGAFLDSIKLLADGADFHRARGSEATSLELIVMMLAFSQDQARRSALVGHMVSIVGENHATDTGRRLLESHDLGAAPLEAACAAWDRAIANRVRAEDTWAWEHAANRVTLDAVFKQGDFLEGLAKTVGLGSRRPPPSKLNRIRLFLSEPSVFVEATKILDVYDDLTRDLLRQPPHSREMAAHGALQVVMEHDNPLTNLMFSFLASTWRNSACALCQISLARIALAIAWYEAEHKAYPATLKELCPRYIAEIPLDPCSGLEFRLELKEGAAVLPGTDDDGARLSWKRDPHWEGHVVWTIRRR